MTELITALSQQRALTERQIAAWAISCDPHLVQFSSAQLLNQIIPSWKELHTQVRNHKELQSQKSSLRVRHSEFLELLDRIPLHTLYLGFSLMLTNQLSSYLLLDRLSKRLDIINHIDSLMEPAFVKDLLDAVIWFGRLALSCVARRFDCGTKVIREPWLCGLLIIQYLQERVAQQNSAELSCRKLQNPHEFLEEMKRALLV